jgi:hypothetical protein
MGVKIARFFAALPLVALIAGCVMSSQAFNAIHIGMTRQEVINLMGQPDSTSAQGTIEYFTYYLASDEMQRDQPYLIRFVGGRVESFGRFAQLYDLYNRPVNGSAPAGIIPYPNPGGPMVAAPAPAPSDTTDLATELSKLKALKDQGVLTDAEFQQAKQKLLSDQK